MFVDIGERTDRVIEEKYLLNEWTESRGGRRRQRARLQDIGI